MKTLIKTISFLVLVIGCKQSFPHEVETALALPTITEIVSKSVVFIAGFDEGDNTYYSNAKKYYETKGMTVVDNLFSLEEILAWLNQSSNQEIVYNEIHIVTHSNPWLGMSLQTCSTGERITLKTLRQARDKSELSKPTKAINQETKIIFHSCGLGQNRPLLQALKAVFTAEEAPKVYASEFFNVYGGKYAPHYLAKPYYNYYPTAESEGPAALAKEFDKRYNKTNIDWRTAIENRKEMGIGDAYSYKFNIPVVWEFSFASESDIPKLTNRDAIMDFVSESPEMAYALYRLNIPLEKYRWNSQIKGNTLMIKGKTTVLCVLEPILQENDENEYRNADLNDTFLYQIL
ncbi:hypothetical protein ACFQZJ_17100 [Maribacter chungangensis]|uniref:DUF4347 domain-containing protein n=1 Tax=Maribacter chungangensis TaxID=1069117 RepID=A0ABW3B798_9FLAO